MTDEPGFLRGVFVTLLGFAILIAWLARKAKLEDEEAMIALSEQNGAE